MRAPLLAAVSDPGCIAAGYVRARHRNAWVAALLGAAVAAAGVAGFGHYGSRSDALAKNGVHTTAMVTATALYGGRLGGNQYTEHIDVAYATPRGEEQGVRIWISEQARFAVGQPVAIVYDRTNPRRAQLANGADLGPIGFPLFLAIVLGACFAILGITRLRVCRAARRALRNDPRRLTVTSRLLPRGRATARAVFVAGAGTVPLAFWSLTRSGWDAAAGTVQAEVYGEPVPGQVLVVVSRADGSVAVGRTWRGRRARRLHARHGTS
jgi:hypothetical protein